MHLDNTQPLKQTDLLRLDQFLRSNACGLEAMRLSYAHGFLTGISSGPEQLEPPEWLRLMFDEPVFECGVEGEEILGLAIRFFTEIEQGLSGKIDFHPVFDYIQNSTGTTYADAQYWCRGFVSCFTLFNERWTQDARSALQIPLELIFHVSSTPAIPDPAYQSVCNTVPDAAESVYRYWKVVHDKNC